MLATFNEPTYTKYPVIHIARASFLLFTTAQNSGLACIDWGAVGAIASAAAAAIGLIAIWYSLVAVGRQLSYQSHLQAKQFEQQLLLRVIELVNLPYNAAHDFIGQLDSSDS